MDVKEFGTHCNFNSKILTSSPERNLLLQNSSNLIIANDEQQNFDPSTPESHKKQQTLSTLPEASPIVPVPSPFINGNDCSLTPSKLSFLFPNESQMNMSVDFFQFSNSIFNESNQTCSTKTPQIDNCVYNGNCLQEVLPMQYSPVIDERNKCNQVKNVVTLTINENLNQLQSCDISESVETTDTSIDSRNRAVTNVQFDNKINAKISNSSSDQIKVKKGKKIFQCSDCKNTFRRNYELQRHLLTHNKEEKRQSISLKRKQEIIDRAENGEKFMDIADKFNIARSTVTYTLKNAEKINNASSKDGSTDLNKRLKGSNLQDVEEAVVMWYKQAIDINIHISGLKLQEKAREFASKLGHVNFKATNGWLDRFKNRNNISIPRKRKSELDVHNLEPALDFRNDILPSLLLEYEQVNIFYAQEVGLLYSLCPKECSELRNVRCIRGTMSDDRLTLFTGTNMTGEKLPLLVVGNQNLYNNCFNDSEVQYFTDNKSWININHFQSWITKIDNWLCKQSRKILLIVPFSPVHVLEITLQAVRVVHSPPSFKGPFKQGIKESFKRNYRQLFLQRFLTELPYGCQTKLSVNDALQFLTVAWKNVSTATVTNAFIKSNLSKFSPWTLVIESENTVLTTDNLELWHSLKYYNYNLPENFYFKDFISFDDHLQTCCFLTDDDIVVHVKNSKSSAPTGMRKSISVHLDSLSEAIEEISAGKLTSSYNHFKYLFTKAIQ